MQLVKTYSQRSNGWYILVTITLDSKYIREREREIEDESEMVLSAMQYRSNRTIVHSPLYIHLLRKGCLIDVLPFLTQSKHDSSKL